MTNLQQIIDKIVRDAEVEANRIIETAEKEGQQVIDEKINLAEEEVSTIIAKAKRDAKDIKNQALSTANIRVRDAKLAAKGDLINEVLKRVLQALVELDDDTYLKFLQNRLDQENLSGKERLILPKDKFELVESLSLPIELARDEFVKSGFMIKDNRITRNQTFESIIAYYQADLQLKIAQLLFNE